MNNRCSIANILQFSLGKNNNNDDYNSNTGDEDQIWFREWSENKIGKIDSANDNNLSFSVAITESDKELTIERGKQEKIMVNIQAEEPLENIRTII